MKEKGILIVVSGFSGAGKGTIMKELLKKYGKSRIDVTIGSALELFGGPMEFSKVLSYCGQ